MASNKKGGAEGVETSAPSSSVNSLLTDLLSEAKKGVEEERKQIDTEVEKKELAAKELRDREEGRKREEAQRKLIEENRRRNEALSKREKVSGEKKQLATAPHMRPVDEGPAKTTEAAAPKLVAKPVSKVLMAALVVGGLAVGVGGAFALQPDQRGAFPDVGAAAQAVVAQSAKAAAAEKKISDELAKVRLDIANLEKNLGGAGNDARALRGQLEAAQRDLALAQNELTQLKEAANAPKKTGGHGPRGGSGLPTLNGSVFK